MARILDKNGSLTTKLHQKRYWLKTELDELSSVYEEKKQRELDRFIVKANKKLASAAYAACDKSKYAESLMDEKLQSYDVKHYLDHRKAAHKAVKAIFKAIGAGEDWKPALEVMKGEEKKHLKVTDLLAKFEEASGGQFASDRMLLS